MSYTHGIRNETSSLYPLHITVDTVCTYSHRFQAAAQRRVPQFPSTASQLPAVLCAPGHVYYSLSMHLTYNFSKKILTYIGIIRQEFVSVFSVLFVHCLKSYPVYKFQKHIEIMHSICYTYIRCGVWRSLVARTAGGREVAGSNPVAPTECSKLKGFRMLSETLFLYHQ